MKEFKIEIPEGYEIDKEKSTFEKIVFKKKEEVVNCREDIKIISGIWIGTSSDLHDYPYTMTCYGNKNVFLNEKYAKSALALAQISQLLPYYDSKVNWNSDTSKFCICRDYNEIVISVNIGVYSPMAFKSKKEAERFLKHNEQLVKDYYML